MKDKLDNLVIPVNKSIGLTTYDVVRRFKKVVRPRKIGHSGTLDPAATGLVLLLTGAATKLSSYLMDLPKRYIADIRLGEATDTQDIEGKITKTGSWDHVSQDEIESVLCQFTGKRMQVPPMYSALKYKGSPLYTLARKGQEVERSAREVDTYEIKLTSCNLPGFRIDVYCSRGMYVRVLAEEIGKALSVPAHLSGLIRTEIGHFNVESAVSDEDFEDLAAAENPGYSLSEALQHLPAFELSVEQIRQLENGISPRVTKKLPAVGKLVRLLRPESRLGAIAEVDITGALKLKKVFVSGNGESRERIVKREGHVRQ